MRRPPPWEIAWATFKEIIIKYSLAIQVGSR